MDFGAVIFDNEKPNLGGWASIRGKSAFRVHGTGDLPSDIYWWSNIEPYAMGKYGAVMPRLKSREYLPTSMPQLHAELGLKENRMPLSRITEITAEIFDRVMRLAQQHYGLTKFSGRDLGEDLYHAIIREDRAITPEIDEALLQSHQTYQKCQGDIPHGSRSLVLRRPRIQHALDVLSTPVPGDQWEFVPENKMPPENQRLDWILRQPRPALAKVSVKKVDHQVAQVMTFGCGLSRERSWMSHPELLAYSKFASIRIDCAFLGSEYVPFPIFKELYTGGAMGNLSISVGLLAEAYSKALSSSLTLRRFSTENKTIYSPRAVWHTASDRFYMMMPALMLHGSGFNVRGYGCGKISLMVQRGAMADARSCAASAGLISPLNVNEDIELQAALSS